MPDFSVHLTNYLFFISAKMCDNDEARCSKRISAEGELRPPNKQLKFWEAAQWLEDDEEYHPLESEDDEMEDVEEEDEQRVMKPLMAARAQGVVAILLRRRRRSRRNCAQTRSAPSRRKLPK